MKKTVIFCYSIHHGNTKKIAEAVRARCDAELVTLPCKELPDLKNYELIGFASGIYMSNYGRPVLELAEKLDGLEGKDCFTMYTSGAPSGKLDKTIIKALEKRGANIVGRFNCRGFDTVGPFKLIGGIQKGHPDDADIENAVSFCRELMS